MIVSPDIRRLSAGATRTIRVGLDQALETGTALTLTSITESSGVVTLGNKAINTATFDTEQNGETVTIAIGQGAEFSCSIGTGVVGTVYTVRILATTDDAVSQTIEYGQRIKFE